MLNGSEDIAWHFKLEEPTYPNLLSARMSLNKRLSLGLTRDYQGKRVNPWYRPYT